MSSLPAGIPLTGTDWFLHAFDDLARRRGEPGNLCHLVLTLDGRLPVADLSDRAADASWLQWLGRLRLHTRWFRHATWTHDSTAPAITVFSHQAPSLDEVPDLLATVGSPHPDLRTDPGLWLHHVHGPSRDAIVLTFHHMMMDARGAEQVLFRLGNATEPEQLVQLPAIDPRPWWTRLMAAKRGRDSVMRLSLGRLRYPTPRRVAAEPVIVHKRLWLTAEETRAAAAAAQASGAILGAGAFHLCAAARALRDATSHRLPAHGDFLVPMPLDRRRRGAPSPLVGNQVSMLFYRLPLDALDDLTVATRGIVEQMRGHMRDKLPETLATLMGMCRYLPPGLLRPIVGLPTLGRMASFGFSDTGRIQRSLTTFAELPVRDAWHLPGNLHPPGLMVICSRYGERLSFSITYVRGTLSTEELQAFQQCLRTLLAPQTGTAP